MCKTPFLSILILLQEIDHDAVANTALKTRIRKDKKLLESPDLEVAITKELSHAVTPGTPRSNLAKIQGRLLSHKTLAAEVHTAVEDIRTTVFPELKRPVAVKAEGELEVDEEEGAPPTKKSRVAADDELEVKDDDESDDDVSLNGRLALSDEEVEDDGWESGSIDGGSRVVGSDEDEESSDENEAEGEEGDSDRSKEDGIDAPSAKRPSKPAPSQASSSKTSAKTGESTFLPSLSVGFTRGDSDASDIDEDEAAQAEPRKNRRGQRARRA
jgi:hypothetical protein